MPLAPAPGNSVTIPQLRKKACLFVTILTAAFIRPLSDLVQFTAHNELYSYVLLVPAVSLYLAWQCRNFPLPAGRQLPGLAWLPFLTGTALLGWYVAARLIGDTWSVQDYLAVTVAAWLLFLAAICLRWVDTNTLRLQAFPIGFLVCMVPLPVSAEIGLETFLQHGSALAARLFFTLVDMPYVYEGLTFHLPAVNIQVAPECSGIHSSIILFITSAVAGYMFLRSPWKRAIFLFAVIPLGLLRNGFRVFVIGELCVHIGPEMIESWIHRRGGPVFFLLSLVPLFLLLYLLHRTERRTQKHTAPEVSP